MAVTAVALGILYAGLFDNDISVQLPYLLVGFIVWAFISGCILEGADVFIANEGLIKHLPAPLSVHVYRLVWRQTLLLRAQPDRLRGHAVRVPAAPALDRPHRDPGLRPAGASTARWVAFLFGSATARFRDLAPITQSLVQLLFFLTPIVWIYSTLLNSPNPATASRARLAEFNPLLSFLEIIRAPMLGQDQHLRYWVIVLAITVVGLGADPVRPAALPRPRSPTGCECRPSGAGTVGQHHVTQDACVDFPIFDAKSRSLKKPGGRHGGRQHRHRHRRCRSSRRCATSP